MNEESSELKSQDNIEDNDSIQESINFENLDENQTKILDLENQISELTDKYYRANADFENIKKRFEKEKGEIANYANEKFARDLLPVMDAMLMAVNFEDDSNELLKSTKEGVLLTLNEFNKCFEKHGIKQIPTDCEFDPNIHNAVLRVDSKEHESGHIVQVMQIGYTVNGRVLRPAMVSIAN